MVERFVRGFGFGEGAGSQAPVANEFVVPARVDIASPSAGPEIASVEQDVVLAKELVSQLSGGKLEAKETSRIYQPETGGIVPLEIVVLNQELPGYGERLLTTILVASHRKLDGSLPENAITAVTRAKIRDILLTFAESQQELESKTQAANASRFNS